MPVSCQAVSFDASFDACAAAGVVAGQALDPAQPLETKRYLPSTEELDAG
ncbi:MAG TPA: hypothetical protein VNJ02_12945 [Vicinamibacterales bacterium]|nr:hypothetical protein [Vicinamibacterales bacterium]